MVLTSMHRYRWNVVEVTPSTGHRHHSPLLPVIGQVSVGQTPALVHVRQVGGKVSKSVQVGGGGDGCSRGYRRVRGDGSAEGGGGEG